MLETSTTEESASAARRSSASETSPVRVLYIGGYGRSGTTVLDILLGEHPLVVGIGELGALTRHVWANDELCSCGAQVRSCSFWKQVTERWLGDAGALTVEKYLAAQRQIESISIIPRVVSGFGPPQPAFGIYAEGTIRLLRAIAAESGARIIVDSSKIPGRAIALSLIPEIDLALIHMVRDGRGVAWSLLKPYRRDVRQGLQKEIKPRSIVRTAVRWSVINGATEIAAERLGRDRVVRLRYEDLTRDAPAALAKVEDLLSLDYADVKEGLRRREPLSPGHQIAGNRLRMRKFISLVPDLAWANEMPRWKQHAFQVMCAWLQRRYEYR